MKMLHVWHAQMPLELLECCVLEEVSMVTWHSGEHCCLMVVKNCVGYYCDRGIIYICIYIKAQQPLRQNDQNN